MGVTIYASRLCFALTMLVMLVGTSCLLEDKQIGGAEPAPEEPDPCLDYCDRVAQCLDENEDQCLASCSTQADPGDCRTAQISTLVCQVLLSCAELEASIDAPAASACADDVAARDAACGGA